MLWEEPQVCYNKEYSYKLYLDNRNWRVEVYYKNKLKGYSIVPMSYEPRCGIDIMDSNIIDKEIYNIINKK